MNVATVLTACGIETNWLFFWLTIRLIALQQCLPLAVLKLKKRRELHIELSEMLQQCLPLAVLKPGSGNTIPSPCLLQQCLPLAVLKLKYRHCEGSVLFYALQQCLPLAVLKHVALVLVKYFSCWLQQCLPLAVLKRC